MTAATPAAVARQPWTEGPWKNDPEQYGDIDGPNNETIAYVVDTTDDATFRDAVIVPAQAKANARLIAAAPQMAEALMELRHHLEYQANQDGGDYGPILGPIMQRVEAILAAAGAVR